MELNNRAARLSDRLISDATGLGVTVAPIGGATVIDARHGGFAAGIAMARVCMSDLAEIYLLPTAHCRLPTVQVTTDHPIAACLASQYAGWQIKAGDEFAMGSGPMRAIGSKEPLFDDIGYRETAERAVGVLESSKLPGAAIIEYLCERLKLRADRLILWVAPTASLACMVQIVARSVETALHKLHELKFDLKSLVAGIGSAPLPPAAKNDLAALGRTNDAILYGGSVHLYLRCSDDLIFEIGPKVPSSASPQFGTPFAELFAQAGHDFYKLDPHLFAPAEVTFHNMNSGRTFTFGKPAPDILKRSFGLE